MSPLKRLFEKVFSRGANPHYTRIEEIQRSTGPDHRKDAVLVKLEGRNVELYVVPRAKGVHGRDRSAVFIHCDDPGGLRLVWIDEHQLRVVGRCDDVSSSLDLNRSEGSTILNVFG